MSADRAGFAEFFEASWRPCMKAVTAVTGDSAVAEEQVAEAFARAWTGWRKVSRHPAPQAWVVRTALNLGASSWRRRSRELPLANQEPSGASTPSAGLDSALVEALRRLPRRQREVIALRVLLDLDTETTAKALGMAPGTVRAHMARATSALRARLTSHDAKEAAPCQTHTG